MAEQTLSTGQKRSSLVNVILLPDIPVRTRLSFSVLVQDHSGHWLTALLFDHVVLLKCQTIFYVKLEQYVHRAAEVD